MRLQRSRLLSEQDFGYDVGMQPSVVLSEASHSSGTRFYGGDSYFLKRPPDGCM